MPKILKTGQITDPDRLFNDIAIVICDKFMEIGIELIGDYQRLHNELETGEIKTALGNIKAMRMLQLWKASSDKENFTYAKLAAALEKYNFQNCACEFCYTTSTST